MIVAKNRNPVSLREDAFALYNGVMQYLYARYRINHIALCVCGAITFEREQDVSWSVSLENALASFLNCREHSLKSCMVSLANIQTAIIV